MSIRPKPPEGFDKNPPLDADFFTHARPAAPGMATFRPSKEWGRSYNLQKLVATVLILSLAGCAAQQKDLEATPVQRELNFSENYQAVYARINKGIRNCFDISSFTSVDGQLYPDLNYGEVTAASGGFSYHPLVYARVSSNEGGSTLEMKSMMNSGSGRIGSLRWMEYWAKGGLSCPSVHYSEHPPAI